MSFVRLNRRPVRTKKVQIPKREWVSTVTDLSVHKPSPEELSRRHEVHRSRNKAAAQWEMREKALKKRKPRTASPPGLDQTRLRLFREVFSDQCQLQDVLARSDRALAVVKDLFGDAPRRQTGFPSVTVAPGCESDSELPVRQKPDPPTQLSLLSQSVMDQQALNELIDSGEEHGDAQDTISFSVSRPKRKTRKVKPPVWTTNQRVWQQDLPRTPGNAGGSVEQAALNATVAVQRLKSKQPDMDQSTTLVTQILNPEPAASRSGGRSRHCRATTGHSPETCGLDGSAFSSHNLSSLELLQDMLSQVEAELACLEPQGHLNPSDQTEPQRVRGRGLTGFSVALVGTLGRIANHMRRREEEAQQEVQARRRMEEQIKEQKDLIDALTAECLSLREDSASLQAALQKRVTELEQRLDMVILAMGELGKDGDAHRELEPQDVTGSCLKPVPDQRDHREHGLGGGACLGVMLSPPRQRDSKAPPAAGARSLDIEESRTPGSISTAESDVSSSSFISLPCPTSRMPRPSQDSVLEQIAELTRQNAAMQAQLGRNHTSPTGASVVREQSAGRNASPPGGQQCVRVNDSSVRLMEDRLQELNRQSAAARAKLLELIEQQKQMTSQNASPTISPIPTHSTSPPTVAVRRTPEVCVSVPERGQASHAKTNYRKSLEADSLQTVAGQRQTTNYQVDELKGQGWFALSAHIR